MSLKRQIARNVARQENKILRQYPGEVNPKIWGMPQEKRSLIANLSRNGITPADLENAMQEGRRSAYMDTAPTVHAAVYNAVVIVAHDDLGLGEDECLDFLNKIDQKIALSLDNDELAKECEEKCGIRIRTREGVGRVEKIR